ncbi:hypothetical protein RhiirA4_472233 [Rhizophagus irregularis]|uniref:Uncharacterized protein n=1 Tax=Rhizophagus irregularis TaxID=588596 RepID=A0A2I1H4K9_9GLOM|nr:hypothetical protein RhiirA4_472233 [Rhizophagus irregularis]
MNYQILKQLDIKIVNLSVKEMKVLDDCRKDIRNKLMLQKEVKRNEYIVEIIEEALIVNEFNLYWEKILITGDYRGWRKKCTEAIWKNEILNSGKLDLFYYNFKCEFDWFRTLKFVSNRNKFSAWQCSDDDTKYRKYRTYKIKNLMQKGIEDWDHIWICECNSWTMKELIESINEYELELLKGKILEEIKILRFINMDFIQVLYQPSLVLIGKSRIWELLRGVYNNNFNILSNKKDHKKLKNCGVFFMKNLGLKFGLGILEFSFILVVAGFLFLYERCPLETWTIAGSEDLDEPELIDK